MSLCTAGLRAILSDLEERFAPDAATATGKFTSGRLTLQDIGQKSECYKPVCQPHAQTYARAMRILSANNLNRQGVMVQIWSNMELDIKRLLRPPSRVETLASYMAQIKESRAVLVACAPSEASISRPRTEMQPRELIEGL